MPNKVRVGAALLALSVGLSLSAQPPSQPKPRVHVVATGGTISNLGSGRRTGEELLAAIPQAGNVARVTVEQFSNVASGAVTESMWRDLATRIRGLQSGPDAPSGFVVTHGTDTMEETAYFLSLTVGGCSPVIVTGAMRPANAVGADGPANLLNAVRVAAAPAARGRGAMILMNDEILSARDATKSNTSRMNAFTSPDAGVLGLADPDTIVFHRAAPVVSSACQRSPFTIETLGAFPRVDVIYTHIGGDSVLIDAAVAAGARALIVAGVGRGGSTPTQGRALQRARARGVLVATSNRTGSGRVGSDFGRGANTVPPGTGAEIGAGDLNPQKARIVVMLGLAAGLKPGEIAMLMDAR